MYYLNFSNKTTSNSYCLREETAEYKANRQYKDSLFRFIFGREENIIIVFIVVSFCCFYRFNNYLVFWTEDLRGNINAKSEIL